MGEHPGAILMYTYFCEIDLFISLLMHALGEPAQSS